MSPKYSIGIDLGTTNTVLSYSLIEEENAAIQILKIPQYVDATSIESLESLPSFLYFGSESEDFQLPWGELSRVTTGNYTIGLYAKKRSAQAPDRTIAAAKSWLTNHKVDRRSGILPFNGADDIQKISPVKVSQAILVHLVCAWDQQFPDSPFQDQSIVLTVPASFDAIAKELTHEAACAAGFSPDFIILEEPQAALYAWLSQNNEKQGKQWRDDLNVNDQILVVDVGGGTSDFSLIEILEEEGELILNRKAVGNHLLVGGDNMDLALAHLAANQFQEKGTQLDAWQNTSLWHSCRNAKEELLTQNGQEKHTLSVAGRGRKLIGGSITTELDKVQVQDFLMNGFLPETSLEAPVQRPRTGFQQIGLAYESDPAITRHLAQFVRSHCCSENLSEGTANITHILFNGGVFKCTLFQKKVTELLGSWSSNPLKNLDQNANLDSSVSLGASFYGKMKVSGGLRIKSGSARSYYLGFETSGMAIPGMPRPIQAICVCPHGLEEGSSIDVPGDELGLMVGEMANFPFYTSTIRENDHVGQIVGQWSPEEIQESDSIETDLPSQKSQKGDFVSVKIVSNLQETGILEIWAVSTETDEKWKFEFNARSE